MTRALALAALLLALLLATATVTATALAATPRADLVDIEDEVMCVTCKIPLNIAEGGQPDRQRALIRNLIAQGRTKEQIKQELVAEYGEDVLALPETSGVGITAYVIPIALGLLVALALVLLVPRWRRRTPAGIATAPDTPALSDAEAARLDEDLARYER